MSKPTRAKPPRAGLPPWEIRHRLGLHDQNFTTIGTDQKAKTPVEFTVNRVELPVLGPKDVYKTRQYGYREHK